MNWKEKALELAKNTELSWREIARVLGKPKSSCSDFLRKEIKGYVKPSELIKRAHVGAYNDPKVLIFDLELSPLLASVYSLWNNSYISHKDLESDFFIYSFASKFWGEDEIYYFDNRNQEDFEDDRDLLIRLSDMINQSDVIVGFNSKKFDIKKLNTRLIINGLPQCKPVKHIDLYQIAKEKFAFTSNSLAYLSKTLVPHVEKLTHSKYPGTSMIKACLKGDIEAWEENKEYNQRDVEATEALLDVLLPWSDKAVNLALFSDEPDTLDNWEPVGYHYTQVGKYKVYKHAVSGKYMRSRVNEFSKEKRKSLLANIV